MFSTFLNRWSWETNHEFSNSLTTTVTVNITKKNGEQTNFNLNFFVMFVAHINLLN